MPQRARQSDYAEHNEQEDDDSDPEDRGQVGKPFQLGTGSLVRSFCLPSFCHAFRNTTLWSLVIGNANGSAKRPKPPFNSNQG